MGRPVFRVPADFDFYAPGEGAFGIIDRKHDTVDWIECRDELRSEHPDLNRFLFMCRKQNIRNTIAFIRMIERTIKLPPEKRCILRLTDDRNILYIGLGDFWRTTVHRSLLTILLRAGKHYDRKKKDIKQVIKKSRYLKNTKEAFARFLQGFTTPIIPQGRPSVYTENGFYGWVNWAEGVNKQEAEKMLIRVKKNANRKRTQVSDSGIGVSGNGNKKKLREVYPYRAKVPTRRQRILSKN